MSIRVSMVMAVRNGLPHVLPAIRSVLSQSCVDLECIVVDDLSTDGTGDALVDLQDPRLRLLRLDTHHGQTKALNVGLKEAQGQYVARLDADDLALSGRLEAQVNALDAHNEIVLLGGEHEEFIGSPPEVEPGGTERGLQRYDFDQLLERNRFCHSSVVFRRQLVEQGLTYRPQFQRSQDYDLWLRMALGGEVACLSRKVCLYRRRTDAVSLADLYRQLSFAERARMLAVERRTSGTDLLEREDRLPAIPAERQRALRQQTCDAFLHFFVKFRQQGAHGAATRLLWRSLWFAPGQTLLAFGRLLHERFSGG